MILSECKSAPSQFVVVGWREGSPAGWAVGPPHTMSNSKERCGCTHKKGRFLQSQSSTSEDLGASYARAVSYPPFLSILLEKQLPLQQHWQEAPELDSDPCSRRASVSRGDKDTGRVVSTDH